MNMKKCMTCQRYPRPVIGTKCYWCGCSIFNDQKALMHAKKCCNRPKDCDGVFFCMCEQMKSSEEDAKFILQHTMARWQRMRARIWWSSLTVPITSPFQGYQTNQPFSGLPKFSKNKDKLCYKLYECVCVVWMWSSANFKVYKFLLKTWTKR